jgi:hypothetical protein
MLGWTTYLIKSVPVYQDLPVPKAVLYTKAQLETLGLDRVYQEVMVPKWVRGEKKLPTYKIIKLKLQYLFVLGGSVATAKTVTAEVIEVHSIKELAELGVDKIKGKSFSLTVDGQ